VNDAMAVSLESYKQLVGVYPHHKFVLMGDSAGGGLALSAAMLIRDLKLKQPKKIVLYSPWLDIRLENPEISYCEDSDVILKPELLKQVGLLYANGISLKDYRVSPIEGNLDNLGEIAVFYGTDEIFRPDCEIFCNEKKAQNTLIKPFKYEGMQHAWVVFPISEQIQVIKDVAQFLKS
jgi:acetyl esterase/lipase